MGKQERVLLYVAVVAGMALFVLGVRLTDPLVAISGSVVAGLCLGIVWTPGEPGEPK